MGSRVAFVSFVSSFSCSPSLVQCNTNLIKVAGRCRGYTHPLYALKVPFLRPHQLLLIGLLGCYAVSSQPPLPALPLEEDQVVAAEGEVPIGVGGKMRRGQDRETGGKQSTTRRLVLDITRHLFLQLFPSFLPQLIFSHDTHDTIHTHVFTYLGLSKAPRKKLQERFTSRRNSPVDVSATSQPTKGTSGRRRKCARRTRRVRACGFSCVCMCVLVKGCAG